MKVRPHEKLLLGTYFFVMFKHNKGKLVLNSESSEVYEYSEIFKELIHLKNCELHRE